MKNGKLILAGAVAIGAVAAIALSGRSKEKEASEPELPPEENKGTKDEPPVQETNEPDVGGLTERRGDVFQQKPLLGFNASSALQRKGMTLATQQFPSLAADVPQEEAAEQTQQVVLQVSRHWPGLRSLLAEFEAAQIPTAADPYTADDRGGVFEESAEDKAAIARGTAFRFHPSMFHHVQTLANWKEGPRDKAGKIFVDGVGNWHVWKDGVWKLIRLAPDKYRVVPWYALFLPQGSLVPNMRRAYDTVRHSQWVAAEEQRAAQDPEYKKRPVPMLELQPDGQWKETISYNPESIKSIEEVYPMGLAKGDSDRVVTSIEIMLDNGQTLPAPPGPLEKSQLNAQKFFPVKS